MGNSLLSPLKTTFRIRWFSFKFAFFSCFALFRISLNLPFLKSSMSQFRSVWSTIFSVLLITMVNNSQLFQFDHQFTFEIAFFYGLHYTKLQINLQFSHCVYTIQFEHRSCLCESLNTWRRSAFQDEQRGRKNVRAIN